jgi:hypothetical protein
MNTQMLFELLIQKWLTAPKLVRPIDNPVVKPDVLFHYDGGYQIGGDNRLIHVRRSE